MLRLLHRVLFEKYPNLGTSVIYGSLNAIADIAAQLFFTSGGTYNPYRTLRFLIFGMGIAPLAVMWNTYLERTYPLRPSVEDPLEIPVQLEGITIDKMREVSAPRAHRRTSSQVSHSEGYSPEAETEPMLPLNGHAASPSAPSVPKVNKAVLLRRVAMDQIVMAPISFIVFLVCMGMMEFLTPSEIYLKVENALWPILLTNWKVWPFVQAVMFLYVPLVYRVPLSGVVNLVWTIFLSWETARSAMA
ncbi:hypothetical protein JCM3775_004577 [Rhodotorula graminis]|uniref:Uncharacterized protein n=1 Tax=Rhodotorula graminis (strain WP1) TaxID=578459 RepID=A0A194S8Q6_RHOGW|nr:uncharacterized protein RHOBADRAFT_66116 [Rhodotorula graminis WP1]KPV76977.1 hypothetical protein RHOBADRAFT_66116 [Rhodotorula graminis WP1]